VNRPVRAVVDSGLAILAALTLLIVATVVLFATAPETVLSDGFRWVGGAVVIVVLSSSGVAAGALAARRLPEGRRMPLALAGPLLVMVPAALPALAAGQWSAVLMYGGPVLVGTPAGVMAFGRLRRAG
jgi:hypothetical protein